MTLSKQIHEKNWSKLQKERFPKLGSMSLPTPTPMAASLPPGFVEDSWGALPSQGRNLTPISFPAGIWDTNLCLRGDWTFPGLGDAQGGIGRSKVGSQSDRAPVSCPVRHIGSAVSSSVQCCVQFGPVLCPVLSSVVSSLVPCCVQFCQVLCPVLSSAVSSSAKFCVQISQCHVRICSALDPILCSG